MKKDELRWKLQLFADDEGEGGNDPAGETDPKNDGNKDPKDDDKKDAKYTDEDVDRILNKKFAEWEKKKQKEIDEAQKLANMTADEKREAEMKKLQGKIAELEAMENRAKMAASARAIFAEKEVNAPDSIINLLIAETAEDTKKAVEGYIEVFQAEVSKAVKDALKGKETGGGNNSSGLTKEQILKVKNRAERQRLINENPKLFGI